MTKKYMTRSEIRAELNAMPPSMALWKIMIRNLAQLRHEIECLKKKNS